ncbi:5366_t:CDS:2 [Funneliformis geosporum]|uniref:5366_t:CDS:1 n=1 Tax=Funneliformis geosporum TaxID=1117311 RepID=A0A9W4WVU5_9GLOM|nr:5366_t:CDS:2 [Funneliformis geosporum]
MSQPTITISEQEKSFNEICAEYTMNKMEGMMNEIDLNKIVRTQTSIHEMLESNATSLTSFNDHSHIKYDELFKKLDSHSKTIKEMKVDLEYIFKKLRLLKTKVSTQYPDAHAEVKKNFP